VSEEFEAGRPAADEPKARRGRRKAEAATAEAPADPNARLTQAGLERHLWGAADLLRGSIDSGDFKHYIFGLLF